MTNTLANASPRPVRVSLYRWAGQWGPFKVKVPCGECTLTKDVLLDTFATDLAGIPVELEVRDWLTNWWQPIRKGGWHAPIVMVEGEIISQGHALNRGVLTEKVIKAHAAGSQVASNQLFGKASCPHCSRAKAYLDSAGVPYTYRDVVKEPAALYEMISRVKPIIGPRTPLTVPQIWLDGAYVGGADALARRLGIETQPGRREVDDLVAALSPSAA